MRATVTQVAALAVAVSLFSTGPAPTHFYNSSAKERTMHAPAKGKEVVGAKTITKKIRKGSPGVTN